MKMEVSAKYAIAKIKRNIEKDKYSRGENVLDGLYEYYIREDEVESIIKSVNKWLDKNYPYYNKYDLSDIEFFKRLLNGCF